MLELIAGVVSGVSNQWEAWQDWEVRKWKTTGKLVRVTDRRETFKVSRIHTAFLIQVSVRSGCDTFDFKVLPTCLKTDFHHSLTLQTVRKSNNSFHNGAPNYDYK